MNALLQLVKSTRTLYQRVSLAVAATLYALLTALGPDVSMPPTCACERVVLPAYYTWAVAAVFLLDAACLWWRILDKRSRVVWATIINACTAVLWLTVTVAGLAVYNQAWSENVGEIMLTLTAFFVLTRTDYSASDKGVA